jgi:Ca2+-binding EF-hand superfamily protein
MSSNIRQVVNDIWGAFDKDNSGFLDRKEANDLLKLVFKQLNIEFSQTKADHVFKLIDANGDGKISKSELVSALESA